MKKVRILTSSFLLFVLTFIGCSGSSKPIRVVNEFVNHLKEKNLGEAYRLLSKENVFYIRKDVFQNFVFTRNITDYKFDRADVEKDRAYVTGFLVDNGMRIDLRFTLIKEDKEWKILKWESLNKGKKK